jgi:hypothetical protein
VGYKSPEEAFMLWRSDFSGSWPRQKSDAFDED